MSDYYINDLAVGDEFRTPHDAANAYLVLEVKHLDAAGDRVYRVRYAALPDGEPFDYYCHRNYTVTRKINHGAMFLDMARDLGIDVTEVRHWLTDRGIDVPHPTRTFKVTVRDDESGHVRRAMLAALEGDGFLDVLIENID